MKRFSSSPSSSSSGFTLLEVLVAFTILALVLGALYRVFASSARHARLVQDYTYALSLAEARLAEAGRLEPLGPGLQAAAVGPFRWQRRVSGYAEGLLLLEVDVRWQHEGAPRSVSLATLRPAP